MKAKRTLSFTLAVILSLLAMSSCSQNNAGETTPETEPNIQAQAESDVPETEAEADPFDGLETRDMGGLTFTFLTSNWPGEAVWTVDDISAEEYTGAPINDAVYERNIAVEDRLKCKIAEVNLASAADASTALGNSITSADNAYQIWIPRFHDYLNAAAQGYVTDLNKVKDIDFTRDAWVKNSIDGLSFMGYSFTACNEMITIHKEAVSSIIFNKSLAEQYRFEDLYNVVNEGRWTLDYFSQLVETASSDEDGDGAMTENDRFGFFYQRDTLDAFLAAGQGALCEKDENDKPVYTMDTEKVIDILNAATDLMYNRNICFNVMNATGDFNEWMTNKFMGDDAMFMWVRNVNIPQLRTMENDFGILPIPKYNDTIDNYYSAVNSYTGAGVSVANISDSNYLDNIGLFIETMGAASMNTLCKAYYDVMLNGIVVRDAQSQTMLDIIYANTTYDAGSIGYYANISDYIYMMMSYNKNFASYSAGVKKAVNKAIDKLEGKIEERYGE